MWDLEPQGIVHVEAVVGPQGEGRWEARGRCGRHSQVEELVLLGRNDIREGGLALVEHGSRWFIDEGTGEGLHPDILIYGTLGMQVHDRSK